MWDARYVKSGNLNLYWCREPVNGFQDSFPDSFDLIRKKIVSSPNEASHKNLISHSKIRFIDIPEGTVHATHLKTQTARLGKRAIRSLDKLGHMRLSCLKMRGLSSLANINVVLHIAKSFFCL